MCKGHPGGTGFEGMKELSRAAEAWHCERPWKAIGEGAASVAIDSSVLVMLIPPDDTQEQQQ